LTLLAWWWKVSVAAVGIGIIYHEEMIDEGNNYFSGETLLYFRQDLRKKCFSLVIANSLP
jgi:hypothetical protein